MAQNTIFTKSELRNFLKFDSLVIRQSTCAFLETSVSPDFEMSVETQEIISIVVVHNTIKPFVLKAE